MNDADQRPLGIPELRNGGTAEILAEPAEPAELVAQNAARDFGENFWFDF